MLSLCIQTNSPLSLSEFDLGTSNCIIKGNVRLPDAALSTVEDDSMFLGSLHQVQEVLVMLLGVCIYHHEWQ